MSTAKLDNCSDENYIPLTLQNMIKDGVIDLIKNEGKEVHKEEYDKYFVQVATVSFLINMLQIIFYFL